MAPTAQVTLSALKTSITYILPAFLCMLSTTPIVQSLKSLELQLLELCITNEQHLRYAFQAIELNGNKIGNYLVFFLAGLFAAQNGLSFRAALLYAIAIVVGTNLIVDVLLVAAFREEG